MELGLNLQLIEKIKKRYDTISTDGGKTILQKDGIRLIRALGQNPSFKEYNTAMEELKLNTKPNLSIEDCLLLGNKMWKKENKANVENKLRAAFKKFDKNGDGLLEMSEFEGEIKSLGEPLLQNEMSYMMQHAAMIDGKININEFIKQLMQY